LLYFVFSEYHYLLSSQYYIRALSLHGPNGNRKRNKTCAFYLREVISHPAFRNSSDVLLAIREAFLSSDEKIIEELNKIKSTSGTTAVVTFLLDHILYMGNLGDSEAVIAEENVDGGYDPLVLSVMHRPTFAEEKQNIEDAEGEVILDQVMGSLAVSRALGDPEYKTPMNGKPKSWVTANAYSREYVITPRNPFLILGCDGLWDGFPNKKDAVDYVHRLKSQGYTATEVAKKIVKSAIDDRGSTDNVSVVIVYFEWNVEPENLQSASSSSSSTSSSSSQTSHVLG